MLPVPIGARAAVGWADCHGSCAHRPSEVAGGGRRARRIRAGPPDRANGGGGRTRRRACRGGGHPGTPHAPRRGRIGPTHSDPCCVSSERRNARGRHAAARPRPDRVARRRRRRPCRRHRSRRARPPRVPADGRPRSRPHALAPGRRRPSRRSRTCAGPHRLGVPLPRRPRRPVHLVRVPAPGQRLPRDRSATRGAAEPIASPRGSPTPSRRRDPRRCPGDTVPHRRLPDVSALPRRARSPAGHSRRGVGRCAGHSDGQGRAETRAAGPRGAGRPQLTLVAPLADDPARTRIVPASWDANRLGREDGEQGQWNFGAS